MRNATTAAWAAPKEHPSHDIANFTTRWLQPSTAVVAVHGDLDASNADEFSNYIGLHLPHTEQLVLDLTGVEFFSTAAFSAVHAVSVQAAAEDVDWILVQSRAVRRLLQICDPDCVLPICDDLPTATDRLQGQPSRLLQLVAKAR